MPFVITSPKTGSEPRRVLRAYQQEAYDRFKDKDSAFLAMEMRLGKTITAIRLAREAWSCNRVFVFAPKIVLLAWEEDLRKEGISPNDLSGLTNRQRAEIIAEDARGFFLLNYEAVLDRQVSQSLETGTGPPDCIILDESTTVKNASAGVTKFFLRSCDLFKKKILLSGLPTPEDWSNIWSQCAILNNGRWMGTSNYWNWINNHATRDTYGHYFTPKQATLVREEFRKVAYCLSRKDANLGEVKIRTIRNGDLPKRERAIYNQIQRDWEVPGLEVGPTETNYAMVVNSWLQRLCGGFTPTGHVKSWKYDALEELLSGDLRKEKAVVWFAFNDEITSASALLTKRKIGILRGDTPKAERQRIIQDFRTSKLDTLLVQQRLGRFGLDLSAANTAIYFSNSYNLEHRSQSEDRIVMPGKKEPLLYIDLITKNTIEEDIYHGLRDKKIDAKWLVARARKAVDVG